MSKTRPVLAAVLSGLLLAACGSRGAVAEENNAAEAETVGAENAAVPGLGPGNGSEPVEADPVPPPDAVSHPDGYLPDAGDAAPPPGSNETPPATEDEYLRNGQAGR